MDWSWWTISVAFTLTIPYSFSYFLWGTLKDTVYREPPTPENMKHRIREACITLSANIIQNAVSSLVYRLFHHCINAHEYHFEHIH